MTEKRVFRDRTPSNIPLVSDTDLAVPFEDDSTKEEGQDADCVNCTGRFSEDHHGEEWIVRNISDGRTHCVLV